MSHIHVNPGQHDITSTAYIVRLDGNEPRALLHMHKKLNRFVAIGGHVELTENNWQGIIREIKEESGYVLDDLLVLQPRERIKSLISVFLHPYPLTVDTQHTTGLKGHAHIDTAFGFTTLVEPTTAINNDESQDLRWVTQRELNIMKDELTYQDTKDIYNFIFNVCLDNWEQVSMSSLF